jgi:Ca2+-binding EF-hand superfamily protein
MFRTFIAAVLCLAVGNVARAQVAATPAALDAQLQKLREVQQKLKAATEEVEQARRADKQAEGEAEKQAAADKLAAAMRRLTEAQRAARQATQAQQAALLAARAGVAGRPSDRETVDPQDPVERFALLTPGGPLIVQASLTIDGRPFRMAREELIGEMIAAADKDKDGQTTWAEAASSQRFTLGRLPPGNSQQQATRTRIFDKNSDGVVQQHEARQFLALHTQGPTFTLGGGPVGGFRALAVNGALLTAGGAQADLLTLLDTDNDRLLNEQEIAAAAERLKSRDADDNDVLDGAEISGVAATGAQRVVLNTTAQQQPQNAILLGPAAMEDLVYPSLLQKYKNAEGALAAGCFPLFPQLFAALDKDQDGTVVASEILSLNRVAPHVELTVDLATEKIGDGLKIQAFSAELTKTHDATESKVVELPGLRLSLAASIGPPPMPSFEAQSRATLMRYDQDANGYLEASEVPAAQATQFAMFDGDEDGKAYPAEIAASYARQSAPQRTQVIARIEQRGNSLLETLDANRDGRLGLREMRASPERLAALDKDQDHQVAGREIPETIQVTFQLGSESTPLAQQRIALTPPAVSRPAARGAPEWFTRMDRNGDGDVTLKEFLGVPADFQRLDANSDGFLDAAEAQAASS